VGQAVGTWSLLRNGWHAEQVIATFTATAGGKIMASSWHAGSPCGGRQHKLSDELLDPGTETAWWSEETTSSHSVCMPGSHGPHKADKGVDVKPAPGQDYLAAPVSTSLLFALIKADGQRGMQHSRLMTGLSELAHRR
jgi:hypothetical protein